MRARAGVARRDHSTAALEAAAVIGTVTMIAGTFAPWLRSGAVSRNSYRTAGLLQRLLGIDGFTGAALNTLPLLAVVCAVAAAVYAAGWRRTSAAVLAVVALAMTLLAGAALTAPAGSDIRIDTTGPVITLTGSVIALLSASALAIRSPSREPVASVQPSRPTGEYR